ncbi:hypothetical protein [Bacillus gaemokensis]|uniref:hypothetical protein n=1 Tax=Bacillus gaemokensis TaxID=574375 RepID=UPI000A7FB722|nr:hypothetical protein [Bacillus gaemokensis]
MKGLVKAAISAMVLIMLVSHLQIEHGFKSWETITFGIFLGIWCSFTVRMFTKRETK